MPIHALTGSTVARLRSAQVVTDSVSVVKELLDNALDAGADRIMITVTANLLDSIKVMDNGCGIAPEDRVHIGKRSHTSKIRNLNDLFDLGGASLGFRGEALASISQLSGKDLLVTTRVRGEQVGVRLTIDATGIVKKWVLTGQNPMSTLTNSRQEKVAAGEGTLVLVQDLLKAMPVRHKRAQKESKKDGARLKDLIRAYAFARPSTRLVLKWIGSNEKNGGLDYVAPKNHSSDLAAVGLALFGRGLTSSCVSESWPKDFDQDSGNTFSIKALLPSPQKWAADSWCSTDCGQYISIDARPISVKRGIGKSIAKLLRDCINAARPGQSVTGAPFLVLNIRCPPKSYDVNIEPAKDDVTFTNLESLIAMLGAFFRHLYPVQQTGTESLVRHHSDTDGRGTLARHSIPARVGDNGPVHQRRVSNAARSRSASVNSEEDSGQDHRPIRRDQRIERLICEEDPSADEIEEPPQPRPPPTTLEPNERLTPVITNPWTLAQLQKPGKGRQAISESSDPPVQSLDHRPRMPPTPASITRPPRQLHDDNRVSDCEPPPSPSFPRETAQHRTAPRQRQLVFGPVPIPGPVLATDHDAAPNQTTPLDRWLASPSPHPASSQRITKPESSPGIALDDIPELPRQRRLAGPAAPFRPVVDRTKGAAPSKNAAPRVRAPRPARQARGTETVGAIEVSGDTEQVRDMVPPRQRRLPAYIAPQVQHAAVTSMTSIQNIQNSNNNDDRDHVQNINQPSGPQLALAAARPAPQPRPDGPLTHQEEHCTGNLIFKASQTTATIIVTARKIDAFQTFELHHDEKKMDEPVAFLKCTEDDVELWKDAICDHLLRPGASEDEILSNLELNIEDALSEIY